MKARAEGRINQATRRTTSSSRNSSRNLQRWDAEVPALRRWAWTTEHQSHPARTTLWIVRRGESVLIYRHWKSHFYLHHNYWVGLSSVCCWFSWSVLICSWNGSATFEWIPASALFIFTAPAYLVTVTTTHTHNTLRACRSQTVWSVAMEKEFKQSQRGNIWEPSCSITPDGLCCCLWWSVHVGNTWL